MELLPHLKNLPTRSERKQPNASTLSSELTGLDEKTPINDSSKSNKFRRSFAP